MKNISPIYIILIVAVVFIVSLLLVQIPALRDLELSTIDWRFQWRGSVSVENSPIVIVTIDDESFDVLPERWPWPRSYYAHVIDNLSQAGAAVIGLDLILDIPDSQSPQNDSTLAQTIQENGNVVLTGKLEQSSQLKTYVYEVKPLSLFLDAADSAWGLGSIQIDEDGLYRRYIIAQEHRGEFLPSFGLAILKKLVGDEHKIEFEESGFRLGNIQIPLYEQSTFLINYAGPASTFPYYTFNSVIDDSLFDLGEEDLDYFDELMAEGIFKDKIVLIGSTVAELHDNFPTPFLGYKDSPKEMPGVEIHANAINTILMGNYLRKPNYLLFLLIVVLLILLVQFITLRFATVLSILITFVVLIVYNGLQFLLFKNFLLVIPMVFPTIALFLSFVGNNLYQYVLTQKEKQMIIGAFERYVPQKVVQELIDHPEKLSLGGEERFMTVLFSDIAGFTTLSENLPPKELVRLINNYLSEMTEIILAHDGIIDKYEGDAIMAEFGAPIHYNQHALKACHAALDMQKRLIEVSKKWEEQNFPVLKNRIGINSGDMIVGNMGSNKVFDYTVLGDEVNLASRLEGANKAFGTKIMISEATYELVKDSVITRPLDLIRVKGKQKPVRVFELLAKKGEEMDHINMEGVATYITGIQYYHNRNWDQASECFRYCLKLNPGDAPSRLYLKRIIEHVKNPPPSDWDGVYNLESK
jgi:adenylate cyclase